MPPHAKEARTVNPDRQPSHRTQAAAMPTTAATVDESSLSWQTITLHECIAPKTSWPIEPAAVVVYSLPLGVSSATTGSFLALETVVHLVYLV